MAIRLLSVDVDGTITNGRNQVTQATADALRRAAAAGVPITNYGIAIAQMHGILRRSLSPFPELAKLLK